MKEVLVDQYTKEELEKIVKQCKCMKEVILSLGYKTANGGNSKTVKNRIEKYNISTDHFSYVEPKVRTFYNVFCLNSDVTQNVLRRWYKRYSNDDKCYICGQGKIWNNKPLTMTLDHINGDNHDNRIQNLRWICPNCGSQLDTFAGKNIKYKNIHNKKIHKDRTKKVCPICKENKISLHSTMCRECYFKTRRSDIPSKEELEILIRTETFVEIGRRYNVSDNAVRKWCKRYNLPYLKKDLKNIA